MMGLLPDEASLHLSLIHFCPSDVFCLPSQIPSASLNDFFFLTGIQVPLHLKITCIAGNQVPSTYGKDLEGSKEA